MPDTSDDVYDLSSRVLESARSTGYALMRANYVDRAAPEMPDGRIQGVAPEGREISANLRDSIWARYDSLRFHRNLMSNIRENQRPQVEGSGHDPKGFEAVWAASWHAQFLFDDLIFNAASLFEYLGNTVWFGFHGQNHIKKKWSKAYEAAKRTDLESRLPRGVRINGSLTGGVVLEAHRALVHDLYGYRSDLIHNHIDGPDIYSHQFWEESRRHGYRATLPRAYSKRLKRLVPDLVPGENQVDMIVGASILIIRIGHVALDLLSALRSDLGWTEGESLMMLD